MKRIFANIWLAIFLLSGALSHGAEVKPAPLSCEKVRKNLENNGQQLFQGGDFQLDGTITCPARYQAGAVRADRPTILRQGPPGSGPMFRYRGADMQFSGQFYIYCNGVDPIWEIEGSHLISTGWHEWRGLKILNAPPAGVWVALNGRYEFDEKTGKTGAFIKDPNHADNCLVDRCHVYGKSYATFVSYNPQAMYWTFRDGSSNVISDEDRGDIIGAYINEGAGSIAFVRHAINAPRFTMFKAKGAQPNCNELIAQDFRRDVPTTTNEYFTLLDDSETDRWVEKWEAGKWVLKASGYIPRHAKPYDPSRLYTTKNPLINLKESEIKITVAGDAPKP